MYPLILALILLVCPLAARADDAAIHYQKATALSDHKRYKEALVEYRAALRINSGDIKNHLGVAASLYYLKRYEEGVALLQAAGRRFPKDGHIYYYLGAFSLAKGKKAEALELLARAVSLDPKLKKDIREDQDLAALRNDKRFQRLTAE